MCISFSRASSLISDPEEGGLSVYTGSGGSIRLHWGCNYKAPWLINMRNCEHTWMHTCTCRDADSFFLTQVRLLLFCSTFKSPALRVRLNWSPDLFPPPSGAINLPHVDAGTVLGRGTKQALGKDAVSAWSGTKSGAAFLFQGTWSS